MGIATRTAKLTAAAVAAVIAGAAAQRPAAACAPAPRDGGSVAIATEDAIVAFDPTRGREDFIRRASFRTQEKDFGFLVPTPTRPELAATPDVLFDTLAEVIKPAIVRTKRYDGGVDIAPFCLVFSRGASKAAVAVSAAPVQVLETKRVAGYDAAVLAADDAEALATWLKEHGYATRRALTQWLEPYVAKRWIITAFKIATPENDAGGLTTEAVRMSFTTDRPFFPYREPADQRENVNAAAMGDRTLRVFVIMPDRAAGALGDGGRWPGEVSYAQPVNAPALGALPFSLAPNAWLTAFADKASPRPGTDDLFFRASPDPAPITPPPIQIIEHEEIPIPIDLVGLVALALGGSLWWRRRGLRRADGKN